MIPDPVPLLGAAWERRRELHATADLDAYRVFHGHEEGWPSVVVERFGDVAVLTQTGDEPQDVEAIADALCALHPFRYVVAKHAGRRNDPGQSGVTELRGAPVPRLTEALELGVRYGVEPLAARNPGLYLDARPVRAWLLANSTGARVLNLFAHTGSLGIAAAMGGAASVVHVETQRRKLDRIRDNLARNELRIDDRDRVAEDAYRFLRRAARAGRTFDRVLLDPPPIAAYRGRERPRAGDLESLVPLAASVLAPGGRLVVLLHRVDRTRLLAASDVAALAGDTVTVEHEGTSGPDFPESDPDAKMRFVVVRAGAPA